MATVNSDDPAYFGGYINDNFAVLADGLGLTREDCLMLAKNSFQASFIDANSKQQGVNHVVTYDNDFGA
jgi:adenosine deaminase